MVAAGVAILALVVAIPLYLSYQFSVVESELEIFNGEMYWGTNGEGHWDVHFPTQSTNWTIEIDIMSPEDSFDFVVAFGLFSMDEYQNRSEDHYSVIHLERINVSEITETTTMDLQAHQSTIRILLRHESGLTLTGHIVARCLAPRWARWDPQ
ncbi:MAG: hypothetical protein KAJ96_02130 [Candidatus Thorarchaeota archaeon]|nr:hypothetical protein [Candidatus Thorarchaeota archaeon]